MLSREEVAAVVRDRRTFYDAMLRHGYLLPDEKQSLCSLEFMEKVRAGVIFCPRVENVKCPPVCRTPPPKAILVDKIDIACAELYKRGEDTSALERLLERMIPPAKKQADTAFLVQVLHLANPADEVFARDYVYVRPQPIQAPI